MLYCLRYHGLVVNCMRKKSLNWIGCLVPWRVISKGDRKLIMPPLGYSIRMPLIHKKSTWTVFGNRLSD